MFTSVLNIIAIGVTNLIIPAKIFLLSLIFIAAMMIRCRVGAWITVKLDYVRALKLYLGEFDDGQLRPSSYCYYSIIIFRSFVTSWFLLTHASLILEYLEILSV